MRYITTLTVALLALSSIPANAGWSYVSHTMNLHVKGGCEVRIDISTDSRFVFLFFSDPEAEIIQSRTRAVDPDKTEKRKKKNKEREEKGRLPRHFPTHFYSASVSVSGGSTISIDVYEAIGTRRACIDIHALSAGPSCEGDQSLRSCTYSPYGSYYYSQKPEPKQLRITGIYPKRR